MTVKKNADGFALMEVLVAMFVLAVGILGAGALQTIGLQANQGAYLRSQAMYLASDMMDRVRENRTARAKYLGTDTNNAQTKATTAPSCISTTAGCSPNDVASADIAAWVAKFVGTQNSKKVLPDGRGEIKAGAGNDVEITVSWQETDWNDGKRDAEAPRQSYVIKATLNPEVH
jgi:type IV pilus assembly protein PilV